MKQEMRGARNNTFAAGHMYRLGNRGLLAVTVSYSMGTPAFCMTLFGVRLMGSNVLKYTRDPSFKLWSAEYSFWTLAAATAKGAVEEELRSCIPNQAIPIQIKVTHHIEFRNRIGIVGERCQNDDNLLRQTNITHDIIYDIIYDIIGNMISHMMSYMISYNV